MAIVIVPNVGKFLTDKMTAITRTKEKKASHILLSLMLLISNWADIDLPIIVDAISEAKTKAKIFKKLTRSEIIPGSIESNRKRIQKDIKEKKRISIEILYATRAVFLLSFIFLNIFF